MVGVTRTLLTTYLFQDLSPAEVDRMSAKATVMRFERNQHICRQGDAADEIWVLATGQLREYRVDVDGNEFVSELMSPGAVFGEPGPFARERDRVMNVVAVVPSEVIRIPRDDLYEFFLDHPPVLQRLLEGLASDARAALIDLPTAAYRSVFSRVLERLILLASTHGVDAGDGAVRIDLRVSQSELAAMVGCTRENVNRVLSTLADRGVVRLDRRSILVTDPRQLEFVAGSSEPVLHRRNRRVE
ncbi:MAG TPA: Crp/Fnr family transcriptional regulator [Candidatus Solibacter sp.]|jgi:CRP-like cAMP-binding protein|nr:Crp/Fnr family transcriptional regulator [Candidatus Solibacter sp.]